MDILVCMKQVPATGEVKIDEATGLLKRDSAAAKVNPYDLYALELALSLKEKLGGTVSVISMGPQSAGSALREAMEIGADRGFLLCDRRFAGADVLATSRTLAAGIKKAGSYDLILCGKQTTDGDTAQVGPEIAEMLGIPHACYVQRLSVEENGITVKINLGIEEITQKTPLPCLLTVEKDINTPRLPSYRRGLAIKEEELTVYSLDDFENQDERFYGLSGSPTQVERIFPPDKNTRKQIFKGTAEESASRMYSILSDEKYL